MKFTFKKTIHEGRYRSFELDHTTIKLNKKEVGYISKSRENSQYTVYFAIKKEKTEKEPASFKWIHLKKRFDSEQSAREKIKKLENKIQIELNLYQFEN